jgi:hypothetical protein
MPEWWNRQTRMSQKHLPEKACGFESRFRHPSSVGKTVGTMREDEVVYPRKTVELARHLSDLGILDRENAAHVLWLACADSWPGLLDLAKQTVSLVIPTSRVFCASPRGVACTYVKSVSKHWPCLFPQHGPGRKHERTIELEPWQQEIVTDHPGDFVRGLFHSDGCRLINRVRRPLKDGDRWYEYPRYLFVNKSADIHRLCGEALDRLGVAWRFSKPTTISVARREAVARLDEFVGPKY